MRVLITVRLMIISALIVCQLVLIHVKCLDTRFAKLDQFLNRIESVRSNMSTTDQTVPTQNDVQSDSAKSLKRLPSKHFDKVNHLKHNAAMNLTLKIFRENECRTPQKRVIPINQIYPSPDKSYSPKCMMLHRCSEDTGCCHSTSMICAPKEQQIIKQHFFVEVLGKRHEGLTEELTFRNHTQCECIERDKLTPDMSPNITPPMNIVSKRCLCPKKFKAIYKSNGQCYCGCAKSNWACRKMFRGEEHLSLLERYCISQKKCKEPLCEFGVYRPDIGRCPNEAEQHDTSDLFNLSAFLH